MSARHQHLRLVMGCGREQIAPVLRALAAAGHELELIPLANVLLGDYRPHALFLEAGALEQSLNLQLAAWAERLPGLCVVLVGPAPPLGLPTPLPVLLARESADPAEIARELLRVLGRQPGSSVRNQPELLCEFDDTGQFTYAGPGITQVVGYSAADLCQSRWSDMVHPDDAGDFSRHLEIARRDGHRPRVIFRHRHQSGSWVWLEGSLRTNGCDSSGVVLTARDVSERRNSEMEGRMLLQFARELPRHPQPARVVEQLWGALGQSLELHAMALCRYQHDALELQALHLSVHTDPLLQFDTTAAFDAVNRGVPQAETTAEGVLVHLPLAGLPGLWQVLLTRLDPGQTHFLCQVADQIALAWGQHVRLQQAVHTIEPVPDSSLRRSHAMLQAAQDAIQEGICLVDPDDRIITCNQRFLELWGLPEQSPSTGANLLEPVLAQLCNPDEFRQQLTGLRHDPFTCSRDEIRLTDGRVFQRCSAPALGSGQESYGRVWSFCDITATLEYQEQLEHQSLHDPLTDLPNRNLFINRLNLALARLERSEKPCAVLLVGLDRFKVINDSLGHHHGDTLLLGVAGRLAACLRPSDTAARFQGDEFSILLEDVGGLEDAVRVVDRIFSALQEPFAVQGHEIVICCSVGLVLAASPHQEAFNLMQHADVALHRAKQRGGNCYEVFDGSMSTHALHRMQMEMALRHARERDQLELHYQPLIDLDNDRIIGFEALVRWNHPEKGLLQPHDFIPLAEETGLIISIGYWVLENACQQISEWNGMVPEAAPLSISVNLSGRQFMQPDLARQTALILETTGLLPHLLELEITETVVMQDVESAMKQLQLLKQLGVRIAVDDFGIGYSSLAYLQQFPLDCIKIDRSFVTRIGSPEDRPGILKAVSQMGQELGVRLTAEGIETAEQLEWIRDLGCHLGQGFLFAKPLRADQMQEFLLNGRGNLGAYSCNGAPVLAESS